MKIDRCAGILLHISSLPSKYGIGSLGENAFRFIDFLAESKQTIWQILPLGPTGYGDSPYQSFSTFGGNFLLIDIDELINEKLLNEDDIDNVYTDTSKHINFTKVAQFKTKILRKAFSNFRKQTSNHLKKKYNAFCDLNNKIWLNDLALFMALKDKFGNLSWMEWHEDIRKRDEKLIEYYEQILGLEIFYYKFIQFLLFLQWDKVKKYANSQNVKIMGDIPIYIAADSVDAWVNANIFDIDEDIKLVNVSGVPPDYFSEYGQLWGNPVFNWDKLEETDYDWWKKRMQSSLQMYDIIRIDHFRGFVEFWAVPANDKNAVNGKWLPAKGRELFNALEAEFGKLPVVAEDLGSIDEEVHLLRDDFELPGMKILQFAFSDPENLYLPHNFISNSVVYTGTHDNNTTLGWYNELSEKEKLIVKQYLPNVDKEPVWELIRMAMSSVADTVIIPLQDYLEEDKGSRMNTPGVTGGNWSWRFLEENLTKKLAEKIKHFTYLYNRTHNDDSK